MAMRWYQHIVQGMKYITSLKKRLPSVATIATTQAKKSNTFSFFVILNNSIDLKMKSEL